MSFGLPWRLAKSHYTHFFCLGILVMATAVVISKVQRQTRIDLKVKKAEPLVRKAGEVNFPGMSARELANLREGKTVADWKREHPDDTITVYSQRHWDLGDWIIRAEKRERLSDGREVIRRAHFYVPNLPTKLGFTPWKSQEELRDDAQLGFIQIETRETNPTTGAELAELTRAELSNQFGSGRYDSRLTFANSAYWSKTASWTPGPATFVSAHESIVGATVPGRVLAFGFLPVSGLHVDYGGGEDTCGDAFEADLQSLDAAVAGSGMRGEDLKPILLIRRRIEEYHAGNSQLKPSPEVQIVDALTEWLSTARLRGRRQYAGALLAADTALGLSMELSTHFLNTEDEAIRKRLKAIGANFTYAQLDGYVYTHGWLRQALRLDRHGPIGDLSLISMMEKGFEFSAACGDTGYGAFRRVIFEGERFLSKSQNRQLRARVHVLVANAYADFVAIADGAAEPYVAATIYVNQASWARSMAISHYRRAIQLSTDEQDQIRMLKNAWRLRAGVAPTHTTFVCVYD